MMHLIKATGVRREERTVVTVGSRRRAYLQWGNELQTGVPPADQSLSFGATPLSNDGSTLGSYGVPSGGQVDLASYIRARDRDAPSKPRLSSSKAGPSGTGASEESHQAGQAGLPGHRRNRSTSLVHRALRPRATFANMARHTLCLPKPSLYSARVRTYSLTWSSAAPCEQTGLQGEALLQVRK